MATVKQPDSLVGRPLSRRVARIARLALGGMVLGGFLGIALGAALAALWHMSFARGLDGALLGFLSAGLVGALYGIILGVTEKASSDQQTFHW